MDGFSLDNYLQGNIYKLWFVNWIWTRLLLLTWSAVYNIIYSVKMLFCFKWVKTVAEMPGGYMILDQIGVKNEPCWISRMLQHDQQLANVYAFSSIIQFALIIKLYFSIKTDWVSCCCWDFLASHQTCRQNCSNSLALSEIISCSGPAMLQP